MPISDSYGEVRPAFGAWLMQQRGRGDMIDRIAEAARADRAFPRAGDAEAVRKRMRESGADGDAFAAIDDAEMDWLSY